MNARAARGRAALVTAAAVALLSRAGAPVATAQNRAPAPEPQPRTTAAAGLPRAEPTRTVQLDAVVFDRKGAPILNLKPGDFEVVEAGVVQRLDAVELRSVAGAKPPTIDPAASDEDEVRAAREPGVRLIALLLDEFHVEAGDSTERVRAAMLRFVDEIVRPADLLVVVKPLESITALRFTRDRQAARDAIAAFQGRKGDYEARSEFERQYLGSAPEAVEAGRSQIVLSALRALTMKLGELGASRSAIVLVSEGFARQGLRDRERRVPDAQGLVRAASRFNVAIYTLDPGVVPEQAPAGGAPADEAQTVLRSMAADTGGETVPRGHDMLPALHRLSRDLDAYYVLTYTSSHPADGRFYEVQVRAKRSDAQVRTRTGYWAPLRSALMSASISTPRAPLRALRRSPLVETWLGYTVDASGTQHGIFTWEPSAAGAPRRAIDEPRLMELKVTTPSGALLFEGTIMQARGVPGPEHATSAVFEAPAGRIQIDAVLLRPDGTRLDTSAQDVDVPDASKTDPLILSPQVFRSSSAREFRQIAGDAASAPVPGREFRRTERLIVRTPAYSRSGAEIKLAAQLVNRYGQVIRQIVPLSAAADGVHQFDLPLAFLAPGEYRIELTATTQTNVAREVVRFKVTG